MSIVKVTWRYWVGNRRRTDMAFFQSREAANSFVAGLWKDKRADEVEIKEGLSVRDVC